MKVKLLIGVPTLDYVNYRFAACLSKLIKRLTAKGVDFDVHFEGCTLVYISRDNIADKAIRENYTHVLWLDSDMVFEPDIFEKLFSTQKDFVTGLYRTRHGMGDPCIYESLTPSKKAKDFRLGVYEIAGCGFGCCLTSVKMLRKVMEGCATCFTPIPEFGEDLMFCKRAKDIGYHVWATSSVCCGHIAHRIINPNPSDDTNI